MNCWAITTVVTMAVVVTNMSCAPAFCKQPRDRLTIWFCSSLHKGFDPKAAMQSFPLEKLPIPTEKTTPGTGGNDPSAIYTLTSSGDSYTVVYRYQYNLSNVNQPYGFELEVTEVSPATALLDTETKRLRWLRRFGAPQRDLFGNHVGAGEQLAIGKSRFQFAEWSVTPKIVAEWFNAGDLTLMKKFC